MQENNNYFIMVLYTLLMVLNHITFSLRKSLLLSKLILQLLLTSLLAVLTMLSLLTSINLGRSRGRNPWKCSIWRVGWDGMWKNICSISKTEIYGRSLIIHCITLDGWTFSQTANSRTVFNMSSRQAEFGSRPGLYNCSFSET